MADAFAKTAASLAAAGLDATSVAELDRRTDLVQKRLVAVAIIAKRTTPTEQRQPLERPTCKQASPLELAIAASDHELRWTDGRLKCLRCSLDTNQRGATRMLKLRPTCAGRIEQQLEVIQPRPEPTPAATIAIGHGIHAHASHQTTSHRGMVWCTSCGYYCILHATGRKSHPWGLTNPCPGQPPADAQKRVLRRVAKGLHPDARGSWPRDE